MKMRFIDENTTSSALSTIRNNSFQSDFWRETEYCEHANVLFYAYLK